MTNRNRMSRDWSTELQDAVSLTANTLHSANLLTDYETLRGTQLADFTISRWIIDLQLQVTSATETLQFCRVGLTMTTRANVGGADPEDEANAADWLLNTTVHFNGFLRVVPSTDAVSGLGWGQWHWDIAGQRRSRNGLSVPTLALKAEQAALTYRLNARLLVLHA